MGRVEGAGALRKGSELRWPLANSVASARTKRSPRFFYTYYDEERPDCAIGNKVPFVLTKLRGVTSPSL